MIDEWFLLRRFRAIWYARIKTNQEVRKKCVVGWLKSRYYIGRTAMVLPFYILYIDKHFTKDCRLISDKFMCEKLNSILICFAVQSIQMIFDHISLRFFDGCLVSVQRYNQEVCVSPHLSETHSVVFYLHRWWKWHTCLTQNQNFVGSIPTRCTTTQGSALYGWLVKNADHPYTKFLNTGH